MMSPRDDATAQAQPEEVTKVTQDHPTLEILELKGVAHGTEAIDQVFQRENLHIKASVSVYGGPAEERDIPVTELFALAARIKSHNLGKTVQPENILRQREIVQRAIARIKEYDTFGCHNPGVREEVLSRRIAQWNDAQSVVEEGIIPIALSEGVQTPKRIDHRGGYSHYKPGEV